MKHPPEHTGTRVRWRQGTTSTWRYGYLTESEDDGSVRVWDSYTGGARSLRASVLQWQVSGPRGGKSWDWLEPRPAPVVTAVCKARAAWFPTGGKAELFNQDALFEPEQSS